MKPNKFFHTNYVILNLLPHCSWPSHRALSTSIYSSSQGQPDNTASSLTHHPSLSAACQHILHHVLLFERLEFEKPNYQIRQNGLCRAQGDLISTTARECWIPSSTYTHSNTLDPSSKCWSNSFILQRFMLINCTKLSTIAFPPPFFGRQAYPELSLSGLRPSSKHLLKNQPASYWERQQQLRMKS